MKTARNSAVKGYLGDQTNGLKLNDLIAGLIAVVTVLLLTGAVILGRGARASVSAETVEMAPPADHAPAAPVGVTQ